MINDYAVAKEKLLSLTDIDAGSINGMSNKQLLAFAQSLSITAATFPVQKEELEYSFKEGNLEMVFQLLMVMASALSQVHADSLAQDCERFLNTNKDMNTVRNEKVKAFIDYFLPMLAIFYADVHKVLLELEVDEEDKPEETGPVSFKDKILTVGELDAEFIKEMSDEALSSYVQDLNTFTTEYEAQEKGLKHAIKRKHYAFVMQWLTALEKSLSKIHAKGLADDCAYQIKANKDFNTIRHEKLEVFIEYFLSSTSILAADIKALKLPDTVLPEEVQGDSVKHAAPDIEILSTGTSENAKTVLIVNKMKMFMNSIKNALNDSGHKLIGVTSAESMVSYLKIEKPNLLVLDEDLPQANMLVLMKIIRATGHQAPILITTGKITKDKMVSYMEAGVADFIMKPITPGDVQKKIDKHLS